MKCGLCKITLSKIISRYSNIQAGSQWGYLQGLKGSEVSWREERQSKTNALFKSYSSDSSGQSQTVSHLPPSVGENY